MQNAKTAPASDVFLTPRMAVGTVYFCFGASVGFWGGSVAEVVRTASIAPETIGSAFFGYGLAGILGMTVAGKIGKSISLKARLIALLIASALCLAVLYQAATATQLIVGLSIFSFLASSVDLIMNSEGLAVEHERGTPVLASFHGMASFGVAFGAIAGSYLSVKFGLTFAAFTGLMILIVGAIAVAIGTPNRGATQPAGGGSAWFMPSLPLIGLGLVVGVSISGELAATMFSAQTLTIQAPQLAAYAGFGATAFALCQGLVRMTGDRLRLIFGDPLLIRISLSTALVGFVVVMTSTSFIVSAIGFAVVGVGTALIVPCGFAMAAKMSALPAAAVISMLSLISGAIRIPSPLVYGHLADITGFASAFSIYALLVAAALVFALVGMGTNRIRRPA